MRFNGLFATALLLFAGTAAAQPLAPDAPEQDVYICYAAAEEAGSARVGHLDTARPSGDALRGAPAPSLDLPFGNDSFGFYGTPRWEETATDGSGLDLGDPTVITWSIVPDGTSIYANNSSTGETTSGSDLRAFMDGIYGSESVWLPIFQQAFDRWGELTGVTYVYVDDDGAAFAYQDRPDGVLGVRGDVRIAGHYIDGTGTTDGNILAYNYTPNAGGDMVIDTGTTNTYSNTADNSLRLRNILAHEHGHGLGLKHSCPTKLMEPYLTTQFDGPQHDDILGANRLYGDDLEPNDAPGMAYVLDDFDAFTGVTITDVSIDDVSDVDYYEFTAPYGSKVRIDVNPVGESYLAGNTSGGKCLSSENYSLYNSLDRQDLAVALLDSDGVTVLASANVNGAGSGETINSVTLSGFGPYYIEVSGSTTEAQMYELSLDWTGGTEGIVNYDNVSLDDNAIVESSGNFLTPRIFTGPPTYNGVHPVNSRVQVLTEDFWGWFLQEWDYQDGNHSLETVGYMIVRDGVQSLGGLDAEASTATVDENWKSVTFSRSFSSVPVVLAQVASHNDAAAVVPRIRNVSTTGFQIRLQEEEAADGSHADERVDWLAVETGTTAFKGLRMVVGHTGDSVSDSWFSVDYSGSVRSTGLVEPTLLAQMQTYDGTDPASIRMRNLDGYSFDIKIQEEQSSDSETGHSSENVGYVLIGVN